MRISCGIGEYIPAELLVHLFTRCRFFRCRGHQATLHSRWHWLPSGTLSKRPPPGYEIVYDTVAEMAKRFPTFGIKAPVIQYLRIKLQKVAEARFDFVFMFHIENSGRPIVLVQYN